MVLNSALRLEMRASIVVNAAMLRYHAIVLMFLRSKRLPDHNQVRDPCWGSRCADMMVTNYSNGEKKTRNVNLAGKALTVEEMFMKM